MDETRAKRLRALLSDVDPYVLAKIDELERGLESATIEIPSTESILVWLNPVSLGERAEHRFGGAARKIEMLRNVLTLAPLIVTWYSLSAATYNYGYLTERKLISSPITFLELWQAGFNGRGPWPVPPFSDVAALAVVLLVLLAACSILFQASAQRAMNQARDLRQLLELRVHNILRRSENRRSERQQETVRATIKDVLSGVTYDLRQTGEAVAKERERLIQVADRLEKGSNDLATAAASLKGSTDILGSHAVAMKQVAEEIRSVTHPLKGATEELTGLRSELSTSSSSIAVSIKSLADTAKALLDGHEALRKSMLDLKERLDQRSESLMSHFQTLTESNAMQQTRFQHSADEIVNRLDCVIKSVPSPTDLGEAITRAWDRTHVPQLNALNEQLAGTLLQFSATLRDEVANPLLNSPLLTTGEKGIAELNGAVARLEASMRQIRRDASTFGAALRALTGAVDGKAFDVDDMPDAYLEALLDAAGASRDGTVTGGEGTSIIR